MQIGVDYNGTVSSLPPFRPLNFNSSIINVYPYLSWDLNTEPDLAVYEIWKKNSLRIEAFWNEIVPSISNISPDLDPDQLTPDSIEAYYNMINGYNGFTNLSSRIQRALNASIQPVVIVGCGHRDRPPKFAGTDSIVAPGLVRGANPDDKNNYYKGIPSNVYLYYLKLFTGAVVKQFAGSVEVWQVENELNAATFAESYDWWRKGNAWHDDGVNGFQDKIASKLYTTIKTATLYFNQCSL